MSAGLDFHPIYAGRILCIALISEAVKAVSGPANNAAVNFLFTRIADDGRNRMVIGKAALLVADDYGNINRVAGAVHTAFGINKSPQSFLTRFQPVRIEGGKIPGHIERLYHTALAVFLRRYIKNLFFHLVKSSNSPLVCGLLTDKLVLISAQLYLCPGNRFGG